MSNAGPDNGTGPNQIWRYDGTSGEFKGVFAEGGGLSAPTGLVFGPDGDLYVSNQGNHTIVQYDGKTSEFKGTFGEPVAGISGIASLSAVKCVNTTTGGLVDAIAQAGEAEWNCHAAGLEVETGDKVRIRIRGRADTDPGSTASGAMMGYNTIDRIDCANLTSGQRILRIDLGENGTSWDCEGEGLVVNPDDVIEISVWGEAQ